MSGQDRQLRSFIESWSGMEGVCFVLFWARMMFKGKHRKDWPPDLLLLSEARMCSMGGSLPDNIFPRFYSLARHFTLRPSINTGLITNL